MMLIQFRRYARHILVRPSINPGISNVGRFGIGVSKHCQRSIIDGLMRMDRGAKILALRWTSARVTPIGCESELVNTEDRSQTRMCESIRYQVCQGIGSLSRSRHLLVCEVTSWAWKKSVWTCWVASGCVLCFCRRILSERSWNEVISWEHC